MQELRDKVTALENDLVLLRAELTELKASGCPRRTSAQVTRATLPGLKDSQVKRGGTYLTEVKRGNLRLLVEVMVLEEITSENVTLYDLWQLTGSKRKLRQPRLASALHEIPPGWTPSPEATSGEAEDSE